MTTGSEIERKRCPGCGTLPYDDDIYCPRCGLRVRAACPGCQLDHPHPVTHYCTTCGGRREGGRGKGEE